MAKLLLTPEEAEVREQRKAQRKASQNGTPPEEPDLSSIDVGGLTARQAHAELKRLELALGFPLWDNRGGSFPAIAASDTMARARACWQLCSTKQLLKDYQSAS